MELKQALKSMTLKNTPGCYLTIQSKC